MEHSALYKTDTARFLCPSVNQMRLKMEDLMKRILLSFVAAIAAFGQTDNGFSGGLYIPVFFESIQGQKDFPLSLEARQVAPGQTFSPVGSAFPRTNLLTIGIGGKIMSGLGRFRPAGGMLFSRPVFKGTFGAEDDVRSSSIPGGRAAISVAVKETWKVGGFGRLGFALSDAVEAAVMGRYTKIPLVSEIAVNGNIVRSTDLGNLQLKAVTGHLGWQPGWIGIEAYAGVAFDNRFGNPLIFGIGPTFLFGGRRDD